MRGRRTTGSLLVVALAGKEKRVEERLCDLTFSLIFREVPCVRRSRSVFRAELGRVCFLAGSVCSHKLTFRFFRS